MLFQWLELKLNKLPNSVLVLQPVVGVQSAGVWSLASPTS